MLGVATTASTRQIDRAFQQRVAEAQATAGVAEEQVTARVKLLGAAHDVLRNPYLRREYDRVRTALTVPAPATASPATEDNVFERTYARDKRRHSARGVLIAFALVYLLYGCVMAGMSYGNNKPAGIGWRKTTATRVDTPNGA